MIRSVSIILTSFILTTQLIAQVNLVSMDSMVAVFRNPQMTLSVPSGSNRVLLVAIANEYTNSLNYNVTGVTLDGHQLIKLGEESSASLTTRNEIELYYLLDSTLSMVINPTLSVTYNLTSLLSLEEVQYYSFFFDNVDQTNPFYDLRSNNMLSGNSIVASSGVLLDNNDARFSVFNSGTNDLDVSSTGNSTLIEFSNTTSQSTDFGWMNSTSVSTETPGFSATTRGSRLTMLGTGIHSYQGAVLPVELTKLSAQVESNNLATISWTTATEKNSDYFIVEKLDDF